LTELPAQRAGRTTNTRTPAVRGSTARITAQRFWFRRGGERLPK
jgi:hypothetical protein